MSTPDIQPRTPSVAAFFGGKNVATDEVTYAYQVTSFSATGDESLPTSAVTCKNDLALHEKGMESNYNTIAWTAPENGGAVRYWVYKQQAGAFGFIGATKATSLNDTNILPEMTITPPSPNDSFYGVERHQSAVTLFNQRLALAGSTNKPQTIWTSMIANYHNFNVSTPAKANEAVTCTLASSELSTIRHLVDAENLLILTSAAEWRISSPITPTTVNAVKISDNGCTAVRPLTINNQVLFISAMGGEVRNLVPGLTRTDQSTYAGESLSLLAAHLFMGHRIVDWAYAPVPYGVVWAVRDDGILLSLTYLPEQQVCAWCQHDTDGRFESVASVPEGDETAVYFVVVRRITGGRDARFVERLASRKTAVTAETAFFVDCGLSHHGSPTRYVGNLHHLEGREVVALADGNVVRGLTVKEGRVRLPRESTASSTSACPTRPRSRPCRCPSALRRQTVRRPVSQSGLLA